MSVSNYCTVQILQLSSLSFMVKQAVVKPNYSTDFHMQLQHCNSAECLFVYFSLFYVHVYLCLTACVLSLSICVSQVTGLSVSPGKDQLVVFHTKDSRDLVVCLQGMVPANESRIGELVGTLLSHFKR